MGNDYKFIKRKLKEIKSRIEQLEKKKKLFEKQYKEAYNKHLKNKRPGGSYPSASQNHTNGK